MRRHAIGIISLLLLLIAVGFQIWPPTGPNGQDLESACLRIGTVMVVIWLAYDHLQRVPGWFWWALPVLLIVLTRRPQLLLIFVPLMIVLAILRPRPGPRRR
jgi:hypothetical protein